MKKRYVILPARQCGKTLALAQRRAHRPIRADEDVEPAPSEERLLAPPAPAAMTVFEPEPGEPQWSGLYDHLGNELYTPEPEPRPIGFMADWSDWEDEDV